MADQGTLFLDEVGELPLDLQPKLLRALQEREIERLGGTRPISINIRLVAATNRDLAQMVAEREFRSDLYYRLKVFPILAPALRDRRNDIPRLVRHFVAKYSQRMGKTITDVRPEAMHALVRCAWPGNIRELENFIERAVILSRSSTLHVLLAELQPTGRSVRPRHSADPGRSRKNTSVIYAAQSERNDRWTERCSPAAGHEANNPQLQAEETRNHAR